MRLKREILLVISALFMLICITGIRNNQELKSNSVITSESDQDIFLEDITFNAIGSYPHDLTDPLFNLSLIANENTERENIAFEIQEDLAEIGIGVNIEVLSWGDLITQLLVLHEFDICIIALSGDNSPDMRDVYSENGSTNIFGYDTSMDYNASLGTGTNQWYMEEGLLITPPYSAQRINHYWEWENYLMDELLPFAPGFSSIDYIAYWDNLNGYNHTDGLLKSWGKMSWSATHLNQSATNEIVIADFNWTDLNPLFQYDSQSAYISDAIMDPLIWFETDNTPYPHVISDWSHINDTHVRLSIREGLKWQPDPSYTFPNETVDAKDVYFTLFSHANLTGSLYYDWIDDMVIVDKYTLDLFIDGDDSTSENEAFAEYLQRMNINLLPEHYLNQTQLVDGITPDITHPSWTTFSTDCFGTGLFEINSSIMNVETNLTLFSDCWWLNSTITSDIALDWTNRFGAFSGGLDLLKIKHINNTNEAQYLFEMGNIDLVNIFMNNLTYFEANSNYEIQKKYYPGMQFFPFNLRTARGTPLQSNTLCPFDSSLTIGLAVRKAIAYAIDRDDISTQISNGEYEPHHHPLYKTTGVWCNPNIIQYNYDQDLALEYLLMAGFETGVDSDSDGLTDYVELSTTLTDRFDSDSDDDLMPDGWEIDNSLDPLVDDAADDEDSDDFTNQFEWSYGTDPNNNDTDTDGMTDGWEVRNLLDPLDDSDADENDDTDTLTNLEEFNYGTNPQEADSDGDGYNDDIEIVEGTNPLDPNSYPKRITTPEAIGAAAAAAVITTMATVAIASNFNFRIRIPEPVPPPHVIEPPPIVDDSLPPGQVTEISDSTERPSEEDKPKSRDNLWEFLNSLVDELADKIIDELCKCQICETQAIGPFCYICGVKVTGMTDDKSTKIMSLITEGLSKIKEMR